MEIYKVDDKYFSAGDVLDFYSSHENTVEDFFCMSDLYSTKTNFFLKKVLLFKHNNKGYAYIEFQPSDKMDNNVYDIEFFSFKNQKKWYSQPFGDSKFLLIPSVLEYYHDNSDSSLYVVRVSSKIQNSIKINAFGFPLEDNIKFGFAGILFQPYNDLSLSNPIAFDRHFTPIDFDRSISEEKLLEYKPQQLTKSNSDSRSSLIKQGTSRNEQALYYYVSLFFPDSVNRGKFYITDQKWIEADIYIPSINTVIEYDGAYFHKNKIDQDNKKNEYYNSKGAYVIRIRQTPLPELNEFYGTTLYHGLITKPGSGVPFYQIVNATLKILSEKTNDISLKKRLNSFSVTNEDCIKLREKITLAFNDKDVLPFSATPMASMWNCKKNNSLNIEECSTHSGVYAWFTCPDGKDIYYYLLDFLDLKQKDNFSNLNYSYLSEVITYDLDDYCPFNLECRKNCPFINKVLSEMAERFIFVDHGDGFLGHNADIAIDLIRDYYPDANLRIMDSFLKCTDDEQALLKPKIINYKKHLLFYAKKLWNLSH